MGYYQSRLASLTSKKKTYEQRVDKLTKIRGNLTDEIADDIQTINKHLAKCSEHLSDGLVGATGIDAMLSSLEAAKEKSIWSDKQLSGVMDNIDEEISRCNTRITELNAQIQTLRDAIEQELADNKSQETGGAGAFGGSGGSGGSGGGSR